MCQNKKSTKRERVISLKEETVMLSRQNHMDLLVRADKPERLPDAVTFLASSGLGGHPVDGPLSARGRLGFVGLFGDELYRNSSAHVKTTK